MKVGDVVRTVRTVETVTSGDRPVVVPPDSRGVVKVVYRYGGLSDSGRVLELPESEDTDPLGIVGRRTVLVRLGGKDVFLDPLDYVVIGS